MGQSAKGDSGISGETVMNDKFIIVGTNANINPTINKQVSGKEINNYGIADSGGMAKSKSAIPKYTPIDNSGDFHGGTFTITAMNSFNIEAANGGVSVETGGNVSISSWGGLLSIIGSLETNISGGVININSINTTVLNGPTLYVDTEETIFNNNTIFGNNVMVHGGAVINGELVARHITTLRAVSMTEDCIDLEGLPINGSSFECQLTVLAGCNCVDGSPLAPGQVKLTIMPTSVNPIVSIPSHNHYFDAPAIDLCDGNLELFAEMKKGEGNSPMEAKPNTAIDQKKVETKIAKNIANYIKKYAIG